MGLGDTTLTAQTQIREYTLTINANGGTYEAESVTQTYKSLYRFAAITRVGYTFTGWTLQAGAKGTIATTVENGVNVYTYTFGAGSDTATANWRANRYEVVLNLNDNSNGNGTTTATLGGVEHTVTKYVTYAGTYAELYATDDTSLFQRE